jgi:hypothetical protein
MAGATTVSGQVLDNRGVPVRGAKVYLVSAPVSMPDIAIRTDDDGRFVLGMPVPGAYRLGVKALKHPPIEHDIAVAGKPIMLTLRLGDTI